MGVEEKAQEGKRGFGGRGGPSSVGMHLEAGFGDPDQVLGRGATYQLYSRNGTDRLERCRHAFHHY